MQIHNRYRELGGEDIVLANESTLLRMHGHEVCLLEAFNPESDPTSLSEKIISGLSVVWSQAGAAMARKEVLRYRPDVVHFHNTFSMLSPAAIRAVKALHIPVVQTLHNYRLICANGLLMRNGYPCEACVDGSRLNAIRYSCYRGNRPASAALMASSALHLALATYRGEGIRLIALTEFARSVLSRGGVDESAIVVKPNFVFPSVTFPQRENRIVFVGRLSEEKGVDLVLKAWREAGRKDWTLEVIGDGMLRPLIDSAGLGVHCIGWQDPEAVRARIAGARYLVMGSRWYEGLPMVILEALSVGTPVILPRLGGMAEIIENANCGLGFKGGDVADLTMALVQAMRQDDNEWSIYSKTAYACYEKRYSPESNYEILLGIYQDVIDECTT